jgi:hypothetical protein
VSDRGRWVAFELQVDICAATVQQPCSNPGDLVQPLRLRHLKKVQAAWLAAFYAVPTALAHKRPAW